MALVTKTGIKNDRLGTTAGGEEFELTTSWVMLPPDLDHNTTSLVLTSPRPSFIVAAHLILNLTLNMSIQAIPTKAKKKEEPQTEFQRLLAEAGLLNIPKAGDVLRGKILAAEKHRVLIDIPGYRIGIVRGPELASSGVALGDLNPGDEVEATVIDIENEAGQVELSFKYAGEMRAWEKLRELMNAGTVLPVKILEANKGGITVRVNGVAGFMPVSQLAPEHYPRVTGGDKQKILEKLRSFVGESMNVKIIDLSEPDEKLIVSEKAVWEEAQRGVIAAYSVGDTIAGTVTALADFGAFVKFTPKDGATTGGDLEGLVHISEIAWQRIDHPKDVLTSGDTVRAKIIGIDGSKIFLSLKSLLDDPWKAVGEKYKVGQIVKGKILKENPFGFFVELDPEIHGLAHISELADRPVRDLHEIGKPGDELEWRVVSVEPEHHRLGLSLKALKEPAARPSEPSDESPKTEEPAAEENKAA